MSWHESVAERRRGAPAGMQRRGATVKARGRAHRVTGCVLHTVQCTPAPEEHSLVQMCWSIVWFQEYDVCAVKMNVLAESVAGGGAFLAGRESWVGSVQDDEGPRLGRVKTPLQSPHFIPYTKG